VRRAALHETSLVKAPSRIRAPHKAARRRILLAQNAARRSTNTKLHHLNAPLDGAVYAAEKQKRKAALD